MDTRDDNERRPHISPEHTFNKLERSRSSEWCKDFCFCFCESHHVHVERVRTRQKSRVSTKIILAHVSSVGSVDVLGVVNKTYVGIRGTYPQIRSVSSPVCRVK